MACLSKKQIIDFSAILKEIAQTQRLQIICMLNQDKELCVYEIFDKLGIKQNLTSHHLGVLKKLNILKTRRDGNNIYYQLNDKVFSQIKRKLTVLFDI